MTSTPTAGPTEGAVPSVPQITPPVAGVQVGGFDPVETLGKLPVPDVLKVGGVSVCIAVKVNGPDVDALIVPICTPGKYGVPG